MYEHLIEKEAVLIVEGTLNTEYHTGNTRLRIDALYNVEDARNNYARNMHLTVAQEHAQNGFLDKLETLIPEKGISECPILINYETDEATVQLRLGADYKAPLDDVSLGVLREYLGKDQVVINF